MDSSKLTILQKIVDAIGVIIQALQDPELTDEQRKLLENTKGTLRTIQNDIILKSQQNLADALSDKSEELNKLADQIIEKANELAQLSKDIKKIGDMIGTLVSIIGIATTGGL